MIARLQHFLVKKVYADHNDSRAVRQTLDRLISHLGPDDEGLNIGAGQTSFGPQIKNMELTPGEGIDLVGSVEAIPATDGRFSLVITQEVLEHVPDPFKAMSEIARVLKTRSGVAYVQLPFTIGYHGCPDDYWRFTHSGIRRLAEASGLEVIDTGTSVGPATGFYRIFVEFMAILWSMPLQRLYRPLKAFFAILLFPIKLLDGLLMRSANAHRISGGYYVVLRKGLDGASSSRH